MSWEVESHRLSSLARQTFVLRSLKLCSGEVQLTVFSYNFPVLTR